MEKWLSWAIEIQSLAQAGLAYTANVYDIERYERLREIAAEMLAEKTVETVEKVKGLFCNETGYQTPKIDTRAVVFKDGQNSFDARKQRHMGTAGRLVRRTAIGRLQHGQGVEGRNRA